MIVIKTNVEPLVEGHKFENVTNNKEYKVIMRSHYSGHLIHDDTGKEVWISKGAMKHFFKATGRL